MLLDRYEALFFNANFKEAAARPGQVAYRGELILQEGEVADAQGRRKPPTEILKQAILLAEDDELKLIAGSLDELQQVSFLFDAIGSEINSGTLGIFFTVNIPQPFMATVNGAKLVFIPLVQGMVWTELSDLVALDKGDFKGQGAADKVVTVYNALLGHKFKYPEMEIEQALETTNDAKRVTHGAV